MQESFPYKKAGNRTLVLQRGTGRRLVSTYDGLQRLQTCTETQDSVPVDAAHPAALTTYGYDVGSRILLKTLPNGTAEAKGYDAAGRKRHAKCLWKIRRLNGRVRVWRGRG
jgi:hypothetical protein